MSGAVNHKIGQKFAVSSSVVNEDLELSRNFITLNACYFGIQS